jgi:hypothetical protein
LNPPAFQELPSWLESLALETRSYGVGGPRRGGGKGRAFASRDYRMEGRERDQVPILPKAVDIGVQIFVTFSFYICVTFDQGSFKEHFFLRGHFESIFLRILVKYAKL